MWNSDKLQLRLRRDLIDGQQADAPPSMLDCGAHMLLFLDQPVMVQRIALRHLRYRLRAARTDIGLGSPDEEFHKVGTVEIDGDAGQVENHVVPNRHPAVQVVWRSKEPVYLDIARDPIIGSLRAKTLERGTRSKLACRLEHRNRIFGMVCVDASEEHRDWDRSERQYLEEFTRRFLSPILSTSLAPQVDGVCSLLTTTEISVARLVAAGMSYKEVAKQLGKSPNTVDNQLRKIRSKLQVTNRVELANACAAWL